MYHELTAGALGRMMNGTRVDRPILQILGHEILAMPSIRVVRYRLLVWDGVRTYSLAILASKINSLISEKKLTKFSVCQINQYTFSSVTNHGRKKRVMVILDLDVKIPGKEVGRRIDNSTLLVWPRQTKNAASAPAQKRTLRPMNSRNFFGRDVQLQRPRLNIPYSAYCCIGTTPIAILRPYNISWTIRARVRNKSAIKSWSAPRDAGVYFSMDLVDETGEIKCVAFREQCMKFYNMIEDGKIYHISQCQVKLANERFSHLKNRYELIMIYQTTISPCYDDATKIPTGLTYDFSPISEIHSKEENALIDVLGVCESCSNVIKRLRRATGKELRKRDVHLVDESNAMVTLSLWGDRAEQFDGSSNPVVAVKGTRVAEFDGEKSLYCPPFSVLQVDPDIPEAHRLRSWYHETRCSENVCIIPNKSGGGGGGLSGPWLTFKEAEDMQLGSWKGPDYFVVKATINMIQTKNSLYQACPRDGCDKKVFEQYNRKYWCEKCNRAYPNFKYQLLANINLADSTDNQWVTVYNKEGEKVMGLTAQELGELRESNTDEFYEKFAESAFKSFIFKLRVKMNNFLNENMLKTTVVAVSPLDFKAYNSHLIVQIKELFNMGKA